MTSTDAAGQGWILTFAEPVYDGNTFLGIVALDLRIDTLNQLTNIGSSTGETMMVSENDHLIASPSGDAPGSIVHPPLSEKLIDWREDPSGDLWLSSSVVKDELWLVHRTKTKDLYLAAAAESSLTWLMLLMFCLLVFMASRLKLTLEKVTRMTYIDPLTQALNRRGFYEKAHSTMAVAHRKNLELALLIMDIDFFKKVNDTYGHGAGDSVLKQLGGYVLKACRPFDLVCRWGGEEFVLMLLIDTSDQALAVAERMRQEAQRTRIPSDGKEIKLSGGLVLMRENESIDDAVKRADTLLYKAKTTGRDHIESDV